MQFEALQLATIDVPYEQLNRRRRHTKNVYNHLFQVLTLITHIYIYTVKEIAGKLTSCLCPSSVVLVAQPCLLNPWHALIRVHPGKLAVDCGAARHWGTGTGSITHWVNCNKCKIMLTLYSGIVILWPWFKLNIHRSPWTSYTQRYRKV